MEQGRHEFLARAALAAKQDADAPRRDPVDHLQDTAHRRRMGHDPPAADLRQVVEALLEQLVLFRQSFPRDDQPLHLAQAVQGHSGQRRDGPEKPPVAVAETRFALAADLLVEDGDEAQHGITRLERRRQQGLELSTGQRAAAPRQEVVPGQEIVPQGSGKQCLGCRGIAAEADRGRRPRDPEPVAGDGRGSRRVDDRAETLQEVVQQSLLGFVGMERHDQVVERLELQPLAAAGKVRGRLPGGGGSAVGHAQLAFLTWVARTGAGAASTLRRNSPV